jgi:hypothetical protein
MPLGCKQTAPEESEIPSALSYFGSYFVSGDLMTSKSGRECSAAGQCLPLVYIRVPTPRPFCFAQTLPSTSKHSTSVYLLRATSIVTTLQQPQLPLTAFGDIARPQAMSMNHLPVELFDPIISHLINSVGLQDATNYRSVCSK